MQRRARYLGALLVTTLCYAAMSSLVRWRPAEAGLLASEVAVALVIFAVALAAGAAILSRTRLWSGADDLELLLHSLAAGLGALILAVLALGLLGLLSRLSIAATVLLGAAAGAIRLRASLPRLKTAAAALIEEVTSSAAGGLLLGFALLVPLAAAMMPEVFYDSLMYHLEAPARWLDEGRLAAVPYTFHLNYPVNTSVLYLVARALDPRVSAGVVHWGFLAASALALVALGRRVGRRVGVFAAVLFVVTPSAMEIAGFAMADLAVVFWCLAAASAWLGWQEQGDSRLLILCGAELGLAVGTKYTAILVGIVPILVMTAVLGRPWNLRARARSLALLGLAAVVTFSPWLIRNGWETGNPLYPYIFQAREPFASEHSLRQEVETKIKGGSGPIELARHLLSGPIELVTTGGGMAPLIGPSLFLPLPLLLYQRPRSRRLRYLIVLAAVAFVCWDLTVHLTRYALPFLACLAVASAAALVGEPVRWRRTLMTGCVGLGLAHNLLLGWLTPDWGGIRDFLRGSMTRNEYIARYVSHFEAVHYANENLRPTDTILFFGEARGYYCRIPHVTTGPARSPLLFEIAARHPDRALGQALRERGLTHILGSRSEIDRLIVKGDLPPPPAAVQHAVTSLLASGTEVLYDDGNVWLARVL